MTSKENEIHRTFAPNSINRSASKAGWCWRSSFLIIAVLASGCDTVRIGNSAGDSHGLLIDADALSGADNDRGVVSSDTSINVGINSQRASTNEVVAYTNRRPVTIEENVDWSGISTVNADFANEIAIPVKVWIVKGPFDQQRQKAIDACITTSAIWNSERIGVRFAPFEIVDATSDPDAADYFSFTCADQAGIEADIGKTAGRINVYYVDTVDGGTGRGQACSIGSDFVAMGRSTGDELLSHEFGHDFALTHVDGLTANFNQTNIMHSASNTRAFVTEGQSMRAHADPDSALNFLYNARAGEPMRNCARDTTSDICPAIERRLWADGSFPAN
jgi:hypothetical protein